MPLSYFSQTEMIDCDFLFAILATRGKNSAATQTGAVKKQQLSRL